MAFRETANKSRFLMKDLDAVEKAVELGAKLVDEVVSQAKILTSLSP